MYAVDFLPVENEDQDGGKSGDAITFHIPYEAEARKVVVVIDGGRVYTSDDLIGHIRKYYGTNTVDLMISTHPDADHLNGLEEVVRRMRVEELLIHDPRNHRRDVSDFSNLEALKSLIKTAVAEKTKITEPFTGMSRFGGQLQILGPTLEYYRELLIQQLSRSMTAAVEAYYPMTRGRRLEKSLAVLPSETLDDSGETHPRNNSSVITLLRVGSDRLLFTGDAGIPALEAAAARYEALYGSFSAAPLDMFQPPHHGSWHNVGPTVLDRILGKKFLPHKWGTAAIISSAKASEKHPSPKVVNALARRGCQVVATEGQTICHGPDGLSRAGWVTVPPLPALVEDDD